MQFRPRLYVAFGVVSLALQIWMYARCASGLPCPRLSFMLGPFGLFFLVTGLHPDLRREPVDRTPVQQQLLLGLVTVCVILSWFNFRYMRLH